MTVSLTENNRKLLDLENDIAYELLFNPEKAKDVLSMLDDKDFIEPDNHEIISRCMVAHDKGEAYDIQLLFADSNKSFYRLGERFESRNHQGLSLVPVEDYARRLKVAAIQREVEGITKSNMSASIKLEIMRDALEKQNQLNKSTERTMGDIAVDFEQRIRDGLILWETGFREFSKNYIDYAPGHMWLVTGRTSVGKTSFLVEMISRMEGLNGLLISTEMTEMQMYSRILANRSQVSSHKIIRDMPLSREELDRVERAKRHIENISVQLSNDTIDIAAVETLATRLKAEGKLDIMFIDYVQQLQVAGARSDYEKHAALAARTYNLAQRLDICIVCFSQVSNTVAREGSDIIEAKGAGDWAAATDIGIQLKRAAEGGDTEKMIVDIKKNRHGRTFEFDLFFADNWTRLKE